MLVGAKGEDKHAGSQAGLRVLLFILPAPVSFLVSLLFVPVAADLTKQKTGRAQVAVHHVFVKVSSINAITTPNSFFF
jgi:hypothetical protein